jgi:hypothetical protein
MASAPQPTLPLFYNDLMPLNSRDHAKWRSVPAESLKWLANFHAIPLTVEEFVSAHRDLPIVFSAGNDPVPLALMGLNEGVNTFVDENGKITDPFYMPAYIRRYPYLLAKLSEEAQELSLCFDPTTELLGEHAEGDRLFDDEGKPTEAVQMALQFCEQFEQAGARSQAFIDELVKHDLLMDGEIAITQNDNPDVPYIYRGFRMVNEEKLRELDGETVRAWNANGMLPLIYAHLFSLDMMRIIFSRQMAQGKVPVQEPAPAA